MVLLDKVGGGELMISSDRYSLTIVFFPSLRMLGKELLYAFSS